MITLRPLQVLSRPVPALVRTQYSKFKIFSILWGIVAARLSNYFFVCLRVVKIIEPNFFLTLMYKYPGLPVFQFSF